MSTVAVTGHSSVWETKTAELEEGPPTRERLRWNESNGNDSFPLLSLHGPRSGSRVPGPVCVPSFLW